MSPPFTRILKILEIQRKAMARDVDVSCITCKQPQVKDIVVVGWIDPTKVELSTDSIDEDIQEYYPPDGRVKGASQKVLTLTHLGWLAKLGAIHPVWPRSLRRKERRYILHWMFKYSANKRPPERFESEAALNEFVNESTNYKLLNHLRTRPFWGGLGPAYVMTCRALIGTTIEPVFDGLKPGVALKALNSLLSVDDESSYHHWNYGDPEPIAVDVFNRLAADIDKRWRSIGSEVVQSSTHLAVDKVLVESYPTYWVYERVTDSGADGEYVKTTLKVQAASPEDHMK